MKIPINTIKTADQPHFEKRASNPDDKIFFRRITPLKIVGLLFLFTYFFSACFISITIMALSILPIKYLLFFIIISLAIAILFTFITFKKAKKFKKLIKSFKITAIIFEALFTAIFILIFFYLNHTMNFMDSIQATEYQIDNYSVLVKRDSKFQTIEDLHYGTIATYDDNSESYDSALEKLAEKIKYKKVQKENLADAVKAIVTDEANSLLIKNSLIDLASEIFDDFNAEDYRVLYTITIETKITKSENANIDVTHNSFNIYISGIDTNGNISTISRSDVNMIVTVNPRTHTMLLTSIPRDYYVQLHGTTGLKDKLTHSGLYGINMTINTIEDLLDIDMNYYVRVNFDSTINLIDALGGIDITPDATFIPQADVGCYFTEGETTHVSGHCALAYARERKVYGTGDMHRIQNQQDVLTAVINKLTSSKTILTEYTKILSSLENSIETNVPSNQIYSLVNFQLDTMPSWNIEKISLEGTHIDAPTYTISTEYLYVFEPNPDSVASVTAKIKEVMDAN